MAICGVNLELLCYALGREGGRKGGWVVGGRTGVSHAPAGGVLVSACATGVLDDYEENLPAAMRMPAAPPEKTILTHGPGCTNSAMSDPAIIATTGAVTMTVDLTSSSCRVRNWDGLVCQRREDQK